MFKRKWSLIAAGLVLSCAPLSAFAQDQLTFGDSIPTFQFVGTGSNTINVRLTAAGVVTFTNGIGQTVVCTGAWIMACGSGSGSGSLSSSSGTGGPAFYQFTASVQIPLVLTFQSTDHFTVSSAPLAGPVAFSYSSPQGNLTGTLNLATVTMGTCAAPNDCPATAFGSIHVTGGTFASSFPSGTGLVTLNLALGGNLNTLVSASGSTTGQASSGTAITAQVSSGSVPQSSLKPTCDFLTGGGWIPNTTATGTPGTALAANPGGGNGKANFGVHGGCKHCTGWGHLNYIDHGTGMHVEGDADPSCPIAYSVVSNGPTQPNGQLTGCRRLRGSAKVNGASGFSYNVIACDNGEPGINDTFDITVSGSGATYHNSGKLGGGVQGGGNIQLHKGNASFCCSM